MTNLCMALFMALALGSQGEPEAPSLDAMICPYDFNDDGIVNNQDLLIFLTKYGLVGDFDQDFDGNGSVGITDYIEFMRYKGSACQ